MIASGEKTPAYFEFSYRKIIPFVFGFLILGFIANLPEASREYSYPQLLMALIINIVIVSPIFVTFFYPDLIGSESVSSQDLLEISPEENLPKIEGLLTS